MTAPTDAERATARALLHRAALNVGEWFVERIATALATERAEGWRAGVEAAATVVDTLPIGLVLITKISSAIRALAGPGEREGRDHGDDR